MIAVLALALVAALAAPQDSLLGQVHGQVRAEVSDAPLAGVTVEAIGGGVHRVTRTDAAGAYTLRDLPAGRARVQVRQLGYDILQLGVWVPAGGAVDLDLSLRLRPVSLVGIEVQAAPRALGSESTSPTRLHIGQLRRQVLDMPPGLVELGDGYRGPPGQAPLDPGDVLYIRGAAERKLVLLDGVPVYTPFHLGGLLEPFEADVLHSASLHLGGAPARYDGGLSYVLDLTTRPGRSDRTRFSGALDMMSGKGMLEGGRGDAFRYRLAGRAIHGLGVGPFVEASLPYDYLDGLARVDASVGPGVVSLTGFGNREGVRLDSAGVHEASAGWANTALSLRYAGRIGGSDGTITLARSAFAADLPTLRSDEPAIRGETERLRIDADLVRDTGPVRLGYGASFDRTGLVYQTRVRDEAGATSLGRATAAGNVAGAYLEGGWQVGERLRVRSGLRTDLFDAAGELRVSPRLSVTWLLGERAALTGSAGRYHQYVRGHDFAVMIERADTAHVAALPGSGSSLVVGSATHTTLSLHQEMDNELRLGVEGFFKSFEDADITGPGRSHASGVDLWVSRDAGSVRGYAGYSLSWVWAASAPGPSDSFAGRHLVNGGVVAPFLGGAELDVRFSYGAGLPFTAIPHMSPDGPGFETRSPESRTLSAGSTPPVPVVPEDGSHLRLDLGLARTFTPGERGASEITPYLRVLNALDQRQGTYYRGRSEGSAMEPVTTLPLIPLLGVRWSF